MTYLYSIIALQVIDLLTTCWIIRNGGHERNPVLIWLDNKLKSFTKAKWAWLVIAKVIGILASYLIYLYSPSWLIIMCVIYLLVVVNNIAVIDRRDH